MGNLTGRTAVVTGGGRGIGRAVCLPNRTRSRPVTFLVSPDASYITGRALQVDGGLI